MDTVKVVFICFCAVYFFLVAVFAMKSKKPVSTLALFAVIGLLSFVVINLTSRFTGVSLPVNGWTVGGSAAAGVPGVITFLVLRVIFGTM